MDLDSNVKDSSYCAGKFAGEIPMDTLLYFSAPLFPTDRPAAEAVAAGFRFGPKGTHSSRTMMLEELALLLQATAADAKRADYTAAIVDANCLSKPTGSTRRLTNQRLGELYGLDPAVPLFRVLRRLWDLDQAGRPLLALSAAIARDPLFAATCPVVISLPIGVELQREPLKAALRAAAGDRLNDGILDKVCRNTASSWAQSGHLVGRTFKKRNVVSATPATAAFAIYLANAAGFRGISVFSSGWFGVLDCEPSQGRHLALEAKRMGLLDLRMSGDVIEISLARLDPVPSRS